MIRSTLLMTVSLAWVPLASVAGTTPTASGGSIRYEGGVQIISFRSSADLQGEKARGTLLDAATLRPGSHAANRWGQAQQMYQKSVSAITTKPACNDATDGAFSTLIRAVARATRLDSALLAAVINVESGFNPAAVSPSGAVGLMQLMPATATGLGVSAPSDPLQNVVGGSRYLAQLLEQFGGNVRYALAAYNAGPGAVTRHGGVPPYAQTQAYIPKVLACYQHYVTRYPDLQPPTLADR